AEFLKSLVKVFARLAEKLVRRVPERQYGIPHAVKPRRALAVKEFIERQRIVRRIPFAVSAYHNKQRLHILQGVRLEIAHGRYRHRKSLRGQLLAQFLGQTLAVS